MSQWFAIRTATRQERKALAALVEQGFTGFLPCETRWRQDRYGKDFAYRPLFPGYMFVMIEDGEMHGVLGVEGVHDFVRCINAAGDPQPMPIPAAAIIELQTDERAGRYDRTITKRREYRPRKGEAVRIEAGPWMGLIAKVLNTPRGQRAQLMVEAFGRTKGITVDVQHLRAA